MNVYEERARNLKVVKLVTALREAGATSDDLTEGVKVAALAVCEMRHASEETWRRVVATMQDSEAAQRRALKLIRQGEREDPFAGL